MYLGEWMKWAEEHSDQVHPVVLAAVKRSIRDQSKEFDGNMERIEAPSPAGAEFLCDNEKCDTMVPDGEGGYCLEERLCPDCLEAAMHVIKQCDHPFCRKDVPEHLAHYVDGGRWRYCRFHAELHDHAEVYDE